jgi:hypothetical protein
LNTRVHNSPSVSQQLKAYLREVLGSLRRVMDNVNSSQS